jgi:hypothetical protein
MKTLIPLICVVALLGGTVFFLYAANQQKDAKLAELRAKSQEADALRTENAELKASQVSQDELTRLRKDSEDVLRLRNSVRQLNEQVTQLTRQLESAQTSAQKQQQQVQKLQTENEQARAAAQQAQQNAQQQAQKAQQQAATDPQTAQRNGCINNLRQIDGAKQQWALEKRKTPETTPTWEEIAPYLGTGGTLPVCPAQGTYALHSVAERPACSVPDHTLAPATP